MFNNFMLASLKVLLPFFSLHHLQHVTIFTTFHYSCVVKSREHEIMLHPETKKNKEEEEPDKPKTNSTKTRHNKKRSSNYEPNAKKIWCHTIS